MKDQIELLINILLDKTAREDERDDAAIDLGRYLDLRALNALIKIASDPTEDKFIMDNCAESIGEICIGLDWFDPIQFDSLIPVVQRIVFHQIMASKPDLINPILRGELLDLFPLR